MAAVPEDGTLSVLNLTHALAYSSIDRRSGTGTTRLKSLVCDPHHLSFKPAEWVEPSFGDTALTSLLYCPLSTFKDSGRQWATWITSDTPLFPQ